MNVPFFFLSQIGKYEIQTKGLNSVLSVTKLKFSENEELSQE